MAPFLSASIGVHAMSAGLLAAAPETWPWAAGAIGLNQVALLAAGMWPRSSLLGANLRRLPPTGRAEVALTFDDGPDPEVTPRVLDLLDAHGARATFFCIARQARAHLALTREIARRGHAVENHTDRHLNRFACLGPRALRAEIASAQATLGDLAGAAPVFFRPPMGLRGPLLDPVLQNLGLRLASWTRRALDGVSGDARAAALRMHRGLAPGDVLLMHDGRAARTPSGEPVVLAILPGLLRTLDERGLRCVTLRQGCRARGTAAPETAA